MPNADKELLDESSPLGAHKETVILVHGTWASPQEERKQWYQRDSPAENSFVYKLEKALEKRGSSARCWAHCRDENEIFHWSGENDWVERTQAAADLRSYISNLRQSGWRCHIVAHSHGGNLVDELLSWKAEENMDKLGIETVVTLGTPYIGAMAHIEKVTRGYKSFIGFFAWLVAAAFFLMIANSVYDFHVMSYDQIFDYHFLIFVTLTLAAFVAPLKKGLNRARKKLKSVFLNNSNSDKILISNSDFDEAWQLLRYAREARNPLKIESRLFEYIINYVKNQVSIHNSVAKIHGAKNWHDLNAKSKTGLIIYVSALLLPTIILLFVLTDSFSHHDYIVRIVFALIIYLLFCTAAMLVVAHLFGIEFFSALISPFRWLSHRLRSLGSIPRAIAIYIVHQKAWAVAQSMVFGLDGYRLELPEVARVPFMIRSELVKYEGIPKSAEGNVLAGRRSWVGEKVDAISSTLTDVITSSGDLTVLLKKTLADQTLIHGSYYKEQECIDRIAEWIAARRSPNRSKNPSNPWHSLNRWTWRG